MTDSAWRTFQQLAFAACVFSVAPILAALAATHLYALAALFLVPAGACWLLYRTDRRREARWH